MDHMDHQMGKAKPFEYAKFTLVMLVIIVLAAIHAGWPGYDEVEYAASFMGVFFIVFAGFKLIGLKEFAYGFQSYDLIAKRSLAYAYAYPFVQLLFGVLYLTRVSALWLDGVVLAISLTSGLGVLHALVNRKKVHCVCLGNVIKLPLSTISFVEDFGMALMALYMIFFDVIQL